LGIFDRLLFRQHIDRIGSKAFLIGCARVTRNLFQSRMSGHCRNLFFGASGFGQSPCGGLPQSVRDAPFRKTGAFYRIGHHVAKASDTEGLSKNGG
jgi:hypothetical protein